MTFLLQSQEDLFIKSTGEHFIYAEQPDAEVKCLPVNATNENRTEDPTVRPGSLTGAPTFEYNQYNKLLILNHLFLQKILSTLLTRVCRVDTSRMYTVFAGV